MSTFDLGIQQFTGEDSGYQGSRFREVVDALFANPYQRVWGRAGEPPLPVYDVSFGTVAGPHFHDAAARTVDSGADLRWGPDRKGFRRIVHPNGVCLIGRWQITADTEYSGYFAKGSAALAIARYSTCCKDTSRGQTRSLSMVGKIFPTTDPNHAAPLRTANFMTQDDIGGEATEFINDVELRNAPNTTVARRGLGAPTLVATGLTFNKVDQQPTIRQLYTIAELNKPAGQPTRAPEFMRLLVSPDQPRIAGDALDFRDEVMAQIFDRGDATPKRRLTFNIELTDEGETSGTQLEERRTFRNWRRVGTLTFDNAVISYNGDFVIHFNHPTWRENRNDPSTATRINRQKVRESRHPAGAGT
jgi:hypothetical protein